MLSKALKVTRAILNFILWAIGSQCRVRRTGVMWLKRRVKGKTARAKEFCTSCSLEIEVDGRPKYSELQKSSLEVTSELANKIEDFRSSEGLI